MMTEFVASCKIRLLGRAVEYFPSSHERSHLLCAFGMSQLPKGTPCYALLWEGVIGSFYEIDRELNIKKLADVMPEPGHRYALLYGLEDSTFDTSTAEFSRFSDAFRIATSVGDAKRTKTMAKLLDMLRQKKTFHPQA